MIFRKKIVTLSAALLFLLCMPLLEVVIANEAPNECERQSATLLVDQGHTWRPPFGVDRIGAPLIAHVALKARTLPTGEYFVVAYQRGREVSRQSVRLQRSLFAQEASPFFGNVSLPGIPHEVALWSLCAGRRSELVRAKVDWPEIEAQAIARPDNQINPVDLGAILVPYDWLLLGPGQYAVIKVAALSRNASIANARLRIGFESGKRIDMAIPLARNRRLDRTLKVPLTAKSENNVLHLTISDGHRELWKKSIRVMVVARPPSLPLFGAVETKLRYDAPVLKTNSHTRERSFVDYTAAWGAHFNDVVVSLPNGTRFVFWRGSSYVPFWAGRNNVGLSYEWAETRAPKGSGTTGNLEAIFDKELRYSKVRIVESTASRIHVRWTYQGVARDYERFGDQIQEDFYFYPDGFGTRVVTIASGLDPDYELSEFIIITPQSAYPLEVLSRRVIDLLYLNGEKRSLTFPYEGDGKALYKDFLKRLEPSRPEPTLYRVYIGNEDGATAVYFNPNERPSGQGVYLPRRDREEVIAPAFWGSHWPLSRGTATSSTFEDINATPAHSSFLTWFTEKAGNAPAPISIATFETIDALGHSRRMTSRRWAWLIGMSAEPDEVLGQWAGSFSAPPSLELTGARLDTPSYSQERRAIRLVVEAPVVEIALRPSTHAMNPVVELSEAPKDLSSVTLNGSPLPADAYAWDGETLWVKASIDSKGATLILRFK